MHTTARESLTIDTTGAKSGGDIAVVLAAAREVRPLQLERKKVPLAGPACASSHCLARKSLRGRSELESYASLHYMEGQELRRYHAKCLKHLRQTSTRAYSFLISPTCQPTFVFQRMHAALWS